MRREVRHLGLIVAIAVFGTALAGANALAGEADGSWEVGLYGSDILPDSASRIQGGLGYGVRAGYHIKAASEIELTWDKAKADAIDVPGLSFDIKKVGLMYVRSFYPKGKKKLVPLFIFGAGNISFDDGTTSESTEYFRMGGGARFYFSPRVALRLDVAIIRSRGRGDLIPTGADYGFDGNLGVSFSFGGKGGGGGAAPDKKGSKPAPKSDTKGEPKDATP